MDSDSDTQTVNLEYRDNRRALYDTTFSDARVSIIPHNITQDSDSDGRIRDTLSISDLIRIVRQLTERLQTTEQLAQSLAGQLEYIYMHGVHDYNGEIDTIRTTHPSTVRLDEATERINVEKEVQRRLRAQDHLVIEHTEQLSAGVPTTISARQYIALRQYRQNLRTLVSTTTDIYNPVWPFNPIS